MKKRKLKKGEVALLPVLVWNLDAPHKGYVEVVLPEGEYRFPPCSHPMLSINEDKLIKRAFLDRE